MLLSSGKKKKRKKEKVVLALGYISKDCGERIEKRMLKMKYILTERRNTLVKSVPE